MRQIPTTYKELSIKGIYELMAMNTKGEYANINTNNGTIIYYKKTTNMLMPSSKMSIKELETEINKGNAKWISKNYAEWIVKYPEVYNTMIDKINNNLITQ